MSLVGGDSLSLVGEQLAPGWGTACPWLGDSLSLVGGQLAPGWGRQFVPGWGASLPLVGGQLAPGLGDSLPLVWGQCTHNAKLVELDPSLV